MEGQKIKESAQFQFFFLTFKTFYYFVPSIIQKLHRSMAETLRDIALYHSECLVEKSQNGDNHAFGKLVGLWFKRIYNVALKYFGDHDLAMEVTQRTFISVYNNLDSIKDVKSFKYWLYKVAINQCHEEERRQKRKTWFSIFQSDEGHVMA